MIFFCSPERSKPEAPLFGEEMDIWIWALEAFVLLAVGCLTFKRIFLGGKVG
jgi:hypothetical protein